MMWVEKGCNGKFSMCGITANANAGLMPDPETNTFMDLLCGPDGSMGNTLAGMRQYCTFSYERNQIQDEFPVFTGRQYQMCEDMKDVNVNDLSDDLEFKQQLQSTFTSNKLVPDFTTN